MLETIFSYVSLRNHVELERSAAAIAATGIMTAIWVVPDIGSSMPPSIN